MSAAPAASPSFLLRLVLSAALALLISLALVGLAVDRGYRSASAGALEERLTSTLFLLLATIDLDSDGRPVASGPVAEPRLEQPGSGLYAGVLAPAGRWQSASRAGLLDPPQPVPLERGEEVSQAPDDDHPYFTQAMGLGWEQPDGDIVDLTLWAAESPERFHAEIQAFRADLWRWLVLAAVLVIGVQSLLLILFLRPLRRVAGEISDIEGGRRERLTGRYPRELQPLTANLNALLNSERDNARQYRQALADLAHALKTPLAVMRARIDSEGQVSQDELAEELGRMEHLIRRQLERAARSARRTLNQPIALLPVMQRLADSLERLYRDRGVVIETAGDAAATFRIDERDLMELCGNLLDNAAKYGRGRIRAEVRAGPGGEREPGAEIRVEDNGPGLDSARFEQLLERGVRGDERAEGQGLGLAIARQLAEAHGGRIEIDRSSTLGGAAIVIHLPPR